MRFQFCKKTPITTQSIPLFILDDLTRTHFKPTFQYQVIEKSPDFIMPPASSMVHFDALASSPTHANLSPQKLKATPSLTEKQRDALIEDLKLECKQ